MDHLFSGGTPAFWNHVINMKCKQSNDVSILAQKYSPVFKKTAVNSERVTQESYIKLISWVALYSNTVSTKYQNCVYIPTIFTTISIWWLDKLAGASTVCNDLFLYFQHKFCCRHNLHLLTNVDIFIFQYILIVLGKIKITFTTMSILNFIKLYKIQIIIPDPS